MAQKLIKRKNLTNGKNIPVKGLAAKIDLVNQSVKKPNFPDFKGGDTVKVSVRISEGGKERLQAYEGVVIRRGGHGVHKSFCVRKMSHGVGVERVFVETSPRVAGVTIVQKGRVRRARLYYLRNLKGRAAKIDRDVRQKARKTATVEKTPAKEAVQKPATDQ